MNAIKQYFVNLLIVLDLAINTICGGSPYETISSRLERNYDDSWAERAVNWIARVIFRQKDHCEDALEPTEQEEKDAILK